MPVSLRQKTPKLLNDAGARSLRLKLSCTLQRSRSMLLPAAAIPSVSIPVPGRRFV